MSEKYYKTNIPWLGGMFLLRKNVNNTFTTHFTDETKFCACSFTKSDCKNGDFAANKGPCPKCFIKCDYHVNKHGIQANEEFLKHHIKNKLTCSSCAFCEYNKTKNLDEHTRLFFEYPYRNEPSISFLNEDFVPIHKTTDRNIKCYYNNRKLIDPFCVLENIGVDNPETKKFQFIGVPPEPVFKLQGVEKQKRLKKSRKGNSTSETQDSAIDLSQEPLIEIPPTPQEPVTEVPPPPSQEPVIELPPEQQQVLPYTNNYPLIAQYLVDYYVNHPEFFHIVHDAIKDVLTEQTRTYVGFVKNDTDIMFKIVDHYNGLDAQQIENIKNEDQYELEVTNKAAYYGFSGNILFTSIFTLPIPIMPLTFNPFTNEPIIDDNLQRVITVKIIEKVNGITATNYIKTVRRASSSEVKTIVNHISNAVSRMHESFVYHGDLNTENIIIFVSGTSSQVLFIDFKYRDWVGNVNNYIQSFKNRDPDNIKLSKVLDDTKMKLLEFHDLHNLCWYSYRDIKLYIADSIVDQKFLLNKDDPAYLYYFSYVIGVYFVPYIQLLFKFKRNPYFIGYSTTKKPVEVVTKTLYKLLTGLLDLLKGVRQISVPGLPQLEISRTKVETTLTGLEGELSSKYINVITKFYIMYISFSGYIKKFVLPQGKNLTFFDVPGDEKEFMF